MGKPKLDYRHNKCKCGNIKYKHSPICRDCWKKQKHNGVGKEKKAFSPKPLSYKAFLHEGEVHFQFNPDMLYPQDLLLTLIKGVKKADLKEGMEHYGFVIRFPSELLGMPSKSKRQTKVASKSQKRKKSVRVNKRPIKSKKVS